MKNFYSIFFCFFSTFYCLGQTNVVPNYSFEDTIQCPWTSGMINLGYSQYWYAPSDGSSDFFHSCTNSSYWPAGVPLNFMGYQSAKTGYAYAGFILYVNNLYYREYVATKLNYSLVVGKKYCVDFYASLADSARYAIGRIGAYLSVDSIYQPINTALLYEPQITNQNGIISDTTNWVLISGEYTAQGGERYISIGNFYDDDSTQVDTVSFYSSGTAYYYIDDVSVTLCDTCAAPTAKFGSATDSLTVTFTDGSTGTRNNWHWDFGDGKTDSVQNPVHVYDSAGTYTVTFITCDLWCCDTSVTTVNVWNAGVKELQGEDYRLQVYPNPAEKKIYFANNFSSNTITIINILEQKMYSGKLDKELDVSFLPAGVYVIEVVAGEKIFRAKFVKE